MVQVRKSLSRAEAWQMVCNRFGIHLPTIDRGTTLDWGRHYLPHYYQNEASKLHTWLSNLFGNQFERRGQKAVLIGPRGGAKSSVSTLTEVLKRACEGKESYILIVSDTAEQAGKNLRNIKAELEQNDRLALDYPYAAGMGPVWQDMYIQMRNGTVIQAAGTGTKIRGARERQNRPSLIICDDIENDDHVRSQIERDRVALWFNRTLMNMGDKRTNVLVLGSALHRESLLMKLMKRPGWIVPRFDGKKGPFKAIEQFPRRMDLWAEWEAIFNNHEDEKAERKARKFFKFRRREMSRGSVLCWPDREPLYDLMKLRAEIGEAAFDAEKQGNPIDPSTCEWPEKYFSHESFWFDEWPEDLLIKGQSLDPSKGKSDKRSDFSAIAWGGLSRDGVLYVDLDLAKRPVDEIVLDTLSIWDSFRPDVFGVETNQFQELLADDIQEAAEAAGFSMVITPLENYAAKIVRIRRLSTLLSQKRIRFKRGSDGTNETVKQFRDFPNGDHDDGPDAIEMLARLIFMKLDDDDEEEVSKQIKQLMGVFQ